jgi:hypothetical protein
VAHGHYEAEQQLQPTDQQQQQQLQPAQQPLQPQQQPQQHQQLQPQQHLQPAHQQPHQQPFYGAQIPRKPSAWTTLTTFILIACILLVTISAYFALSLRTQAQNQDKTQAQESLDSFLDAAVKQDPKWKDFATPRLVQSIPVGAPFGGERQTAKAIDLKVSYELGEIDFEVSGDLASVPVEVIFSFTAGGKAVKSTTTQTIWLSRPFYYGDDVAQRADYVENPTAIGPWQVTGITDESDYGTDEEANASASTTLQVEYDADLDVSECYEDEAILLGLSTSARIEGKALTKCYLDDTADKNGVNPKELAKSFPMLYERSEVETPPDIVHLDNSFSSRREPGLREYFIKGEGGVFIIAIAGVSTGEAGEGIADSGRVVTIQKIEDTQ